MGEDERGDQTVARISLVVYETPVPIFRGNLGQMAFLRPTIALEEPSVPHAKFVNFGLWQSFRDLLAMLG